jgi:NADPH:quinone reductase-like Zn-dependent oxidoreductase
MKAVVIKEKGSFDHIAVEEVGKPVIQSDEILVKIIGAGVNPVDWKNLFYDYWGLPIIPGTDISGVIVEVGAAIKNYKPGDEIIGSLQWDKQSAFAEYVATKEQYITHKPKNLSIEKSAGIPLASLTAWQALFDHGHVEKGQKVVIHAGAGGVGLFALQFAKWKGAHVIVTASERNIDFLYTVGADEVIDYTKYRLSDKVKDADMVLDSIVTPEAQLESFKILKKKGRYIAITANIREELVKDFDIYTNRFLFHSDAGQLKQIVQLIEEEKVRVFIDRIYPLSEAKNALEYVHTGRARGKVILINN